MFLGGSERASRGRRGTRRCHAAESRGLGRWGGWAGRANPPHLSGAGGGRGGPPDRPSGREPARSARGGTWGVQRPRSQRGSPAPGDGLDPTICRTSGASRRRNGAGPRVPPAAGHPGGVPRTLPAATGQLSGVGGDGDDRDLSALGQVPEDSIGAGRAIPGVDPDLLTSSLAAVEVAAAGGRCGSC
jgi:hypothetical protein